MNESLLIHSASHSYPVWIEDGVRYHTAELVKKAVPDYTKVFIIADEKVGKLYIEDILSSFPEKSRPDYTLLPSGEMSKSFAEYERLITECLHQGLDRKSVILALGGGVTGDIAGFTAATYMRGIPFIQIPTTLLAHDSSVGGKTGINHPGAKNMVGAFHAPHGVIYDPEMLNSLPPEEWRSGYAEVIKHALISDKDFLNWLIENVRDLSLLEGKRLKELLKRSIQVKAEVVQKDERESGIRAYLNFGHTLGHALESYAGYGKLTHGEAVASGMVFAMRLSSAELNAVLPEKQLREYMESLGYRLDLEKEAEAEKLIQLMKKDKKTSGGRINFVLLEKVGRPVLKKTSEKTMLLLLENEVTE
ncbi:MAG: 3-dehydroquinate synthase [Alkalicoccus sp.]|nr:MAG: 3-dehydroquinate synthase [Alkalicoccus sp.]